MYDIEKLPVSTI